MRLEGRGGRRSPPGTRQESRESQEVRFAQGAETVGVGLQQTELATGLLDEGL